jgi:ribokinase
VHLAVVGHVEWIQFVRVEHVPSPGEIVHAREVWEEPGGGGAVTAVQLARLGGSCTFFTAVGDDDVGRRAVEELGARGTRVEAAVRAEPQRRAVVFVDAVGERTITLLSHKLRPAGPDDLPWDELGGADAVYFTGGDDEALRLARRARLLVATARELPTLVAAGVPIDVLVRSGRDTGERYQRGALHPEPWLSVATRGGEGGTYSVEGGPDVPFPAVPLPGPVGDAYGAGDSFAAGITYALARGLDVPAALDFAARCGAAVMTGRGPYGAPLPSV